MKISEHIYIISNEHPIIVFDGVCHLCDLSVQWILKRDAKATFRFIPVQNLLGVNDTNLSLDSVMLISKGNIFVKSSAILEVLRLLGGVYFVIFLIMRYVPNFLANKMYDFIAAKRYQWFGKYANCKLPAGKWKDRFL